MMIFLVGVLFSFLVADLFLYVHVLRKISRWEQFFYDNSDIEEFRCLHCLLRLSCYPYEANIRPSYPCDNFHAKKSEGR